MKRQNNVLALAHKETEGERPLRESVRFQYEVPSIGLAAWGQGFWSPLVVLIDPLGTCKQTSRAAKTVVFWFEKIYKSFAKGLKRDFVLRSRLSWTCLDCPPSRCQQLDEQVTAAGRYPCACNMHVVGPRVCIFRPI